MSGTKEGGLKAKAALIRNNPNHFSEIGKKGGKRKVPKGFAMIDPELRRIFGAKGGSTSRMNKKTEE